MVESSKGDAPEDTDTDEMHPCCIQSGPRIDEEEVLKSSRWLCYCCCCCGVGTLNHTNHPAHLVTKCICCQQSCEMKEVETLEGACGSLQTCCFCTPLWQCPPPEGIPRCKICGAHYFGFKRRAPEAHVQETVAGKARDASYPHDDPYTQFEKVVFEDIIPCYCYCCGCGLNPFFQTIYDAYFKCLCCRYTASCIPPCEEAGLVCCRFVLNAGLCTAHCRCPAASTYNPMFACCGKRLKRVHHMPGTFQK
jgi:hypothetical protein